jgi:uncharacterized membrane protein YedE/YeeE
MEAMYEAVFVREWPWWVGGPAIGLYVIAFLLHRNRLLSASATYQFVAEQWIGRLFGRKASEHEWLTGPAGAEPDWQGFYFIGLFGGGLASAGLAGWAPGWALPGLSATYPFAPAVQAGILFLAGVLIGFGTRMGAGCTSGHCIVGVSGLQAPSAVATAVFFGSGIAVSFAVEWLRAGGAT